MSGTLKKLREFKTRVRSDGEQQFFSEDSFATVVR